VNPTIRRQFARLAAAILVTPTTLALGTGLYRLAPPEIQLVLSVALESWGFVACIRLLWWLIDRLGTGTCPLVVDLGLLAPHNRPRRCGRPATRRVTIVCDHGCQRDPVWACPMHLAMTDLSQSICKVCQAAGRPNVRVRLVEDQ